MQQVLSRTSVEWIVDGLPDRKWAKKYKKYYFFFEKVRQFFSKKYYKSTTFLQKVQLKYDFRKEYFFLEGIFLPKFYGEVSPKKQTEIWRQNKDLTLKVRGHT